MCVLFCESVNSALLRSMPKSITLHRYFNSFMGIPYSRTIYLKLAAVKDSLIDLACTLGFITDPQSIRVDGYEAQFRVTSAAERWRVRHQMREGVVIEKLLREIKTGDCFWDVGAAVGTYSCLAADAGATPVAFEPHPKNQARCVENFTLNQIDGEIFKFALSNKSKTMQLPKSGAVGTGTFQLSESGDVGVDTVRGDDVDAPDPDVVKIDVEGHEMQVLEGMSELLDTVRVIFVESHPNHGVEVEEVKAVLCKHGFEIETINLDRIEPYIVGRRIQTNSS